MIIFGTRTLTSSRLSGTFHCPRCGTNRSYQHQRLNRWFTLYFIPCIPMGNAGEYIECVSCGGTYGMEVLSYDPVAERLETYALLRRLTVLAMLAANRFGDEHIAALCSTLQQHSGDFVTAQQVLEDARLAREAGVQLAPVLQTQTAEFSADGKVFLLQLMAAAVTPSGHIGMVERQTLNEAADAMGVPRDVAEQVMTGMIGQ